MTLNSEYTFAVQNRQITKKIKEIKEQQSTDDQKNYYKKKDYESLTKLYFRMFYVYILLAIVSFYFIFYATYNIYKKMFIALFIIAFPFIIYIIEYHLYFLLNFIYVLIFGKPYEKP